MNMWFLVIVLIGGGVEQHIAVEMPNREVCEGIAQGYVHAAAYGAESMEVDEVSCEESNDG